MIMAPTRFIPDHFGAEQAMGDLIGAEFRDLSLITGSETALVPAPKGAATDPRMARVAGGSTPAGSPGR